MGGSNVADVGAVNIEVGSELDAITPHALDAQNTMHRLKRRRHDDCTTCRLGDSWPAAERTSVLLVGRAGCEGGRASAWIDSSVSSTEGTHSRPEGGNRINFALSCRDIAEIFALQDKPDESRVQCEFGAYLCALSLIQRNLLCWPTRRESTSLWSAAR